MTEDNMNRRLKPYEVAEEEETEMIRIIAFGTLVDGAPTYHPDDSGDARKLCDRLNAAYLAGTQKTSEPNVSAADGAAGLVKEAYRNGVAGKTAPKGDDDDDDEDPGYNPMK